MTLSGAHRVGDYVRISCGHCRITRWYMPWDILQLVGDIEADRIPSRMRCETCRLKDHLRASFENPVGADGAKLRLRRLKEIRLVKKVVWVDDG